MYQALPAIKKDGPVKILIGLDLSGSIFGNTTYRNLYRYYLSQLTGQLMYKDCIVKVFGWDTRLFNEATFNSSNILDLPDYVDHLFSAKVGRGGSDIEALYAFNIDSAFNADCVINMTDGYLQFPKDHMEDVEQNIVVVINDSYNDFVKANLKYFKTTEVIFATYDD